MTRSADREAGFALLVVLAFLLLAGSIATPFFTSARDYAFIARNAAHDSQEDLVLEGVLQLAAQRYLENTNNRTKLPRSIHCESSGRYPVLTVSFQNDAGLIDLNSAAPALLQLGFEAIGSDPADAIRLATTVELYRTVDMGMSRTVEANEVVGGLKHGLFENVAELLDFPLPPSATLDRLHGAFTVLSRNGALNEDLVSPMLQEAVRSMTRDEGALAEANAGQLPALTVSATLQTAAGAYLRSTANFVPDAEMQRLVRNGPVASQRAMEGASSELRGQPLPCGQYFDAGSLALLSELMK